MQLYFDEAISSVYFFNTDFDGFGGAFLVKKSNNSHLYIINFSNRRIKRNTRRFMGFYSCCENAISPKES